MAKADPRRIVQVTPDRDGQISAAALNIALKQLSDMIYQQEGRTGGSKIRDTLEVTAQDTAALRLKSFTYKSGSHEFGFLGADGNNAYQAKGATVVVDANGVEAWTATSVTAVIWRFIGPITFLYNKQNLTPGQQFVLGNPLYTFDGNNNLTVVGSLVVQGTTTANQTINAVQYPHARFRVATAAGLNPIAWDTTDATGNFTLVSTTDITCNVAGVYYIICVLGTTQTAPSTGTANIKVNGTVVGAAQVSNSDAATTGAYNYTIVWVGSLAVNDVVTVTLTGAGVSMRTSGGAGQNTINLFRMVDTT